MALPKTTSVHGCNNNAYNKGQKKLVLEYNISVLVLDV